MHRHTSILVIILILSCLTALADEPVTGEEWFAEANKLFENGSHADALKAFGKAFELGYLPQESAFGAAKAAALGRNVPGTREWIRRAVRFGLRDLDLVRDDPAFARLIEKKVLLGFLAGLEKRIHPCWAPDYRALDFWVGDWSVRDTVSGNAVGESRVEIVMDKCVVTENWTGEWGSTGSSFNVFEKKKGTWRQTWVDSSGQIYDFVGTPSGNQMVYTREITTKEDKTVHIKMTLSRLENGDVRQMSESSEDGGEIWVVNYDYTYGPKQ